MLIRALIVLLLVLNVGVGVWWVARPQPNPPAVPAPPQGVTRLQLLKEAPNAPRPVAAVPGDAALADATASGAVALAGDVATPATAVPVPDAKDARSQASPAAPGADKASADKADSDKAKDKKAAEAAQAKAEEAAKAQANTVGQCFRFGPYADAGALARARSQLQPFAQRVVERQQQTPGGRGWRVFLRPAATLADAQANAQRVAAAGFSDYFVVREGADANSVSLGRYRSEDSARKRAAALNAVGFAAQAEPLGETTPTLWLEVAGKGGADASAMRQAASAQQRHGIRCDSIKG